MSHKVSAVKASAGKASAGKAPFLPTLFLPTLFLPTLFLPTLFPPTVLAEEEPPKVESKTVTGRVSAVNARGIAIEYARAVSKVHEIYLPLSETVKLERVASVAHLRYGDTVRVGYEQTSKEGPDGQQIILGKVAKEITLLKAAPEEQVLASDQEGQDDGS